MEKKLWLWNICKKNSFEISDAKLDSLERFCNELLSWNKKINLISRRDEENVWNKHFLGSLGFLFRFQLVSGTSVLDLGTGGGLPGIPLAIIQPSLKLTLVDSIKKKIMAVNDILTVLSISNVTTVCGRAEELSAQKEFKHPFDYIITRAVGSIDDVVKWSKDLIKPAQGKISDLTRNNGGRASIQSGAILLLKGGELTDEIEVAKRKHKPRYITSFPIIIDGIDSSELADKKLVIVYP